MSTADDRSPGSSAAPRSTIIADLQVRISRNVKVAILVLVAIGIGFTIGRWAFRHHAADPFAVKSDFAPAEYLYLDQTRVVAFLSQIDGGLTSTEKRTLSHLESVNANVQAASGFQAGGTSQDQSALETTVTPTAASQFYRLESLLRQKKYIHRLDARPADPRQFFAALNHEGDFAFITGCRLVLPNFARLYQYLKGPPLLPLTLTVASGSAEGIRILFPVSYAALANEPSLFSTDLTVVGKVVRVVSSSSRYSDSPSLLAFRRAVSQHKRELRLLHLPPTAIMRQFRDAVTVAGEGAVILPVAIFD